MARTSISLPDDLVERLEPLKGQINVSNVCQMALEGRIRVHEQILAALSNEDVMKGLVERLRIQKSDAIDQSRAWKEDGKDWMIRHATYQEGELWGTVTFIDRPARNQFEYDTPDGWDEGGQPIIELFMPDDAAAASLFAERQKYAGSNHLPLERGAYSTGFRDSVREIWNQIKDEL